MGWRTGPGVKDPGALGAIGGQQELTPCLAVDFGPEPVKPRDECGLEAEVAGAMDDEKGIARCA
jgi:hypothetical protein